MHFPSALRALGAIAPIAFAPLAANAAVLFVNPGAQAPRNGSSFARGFPTVHAGLAAAQSGDEVWVENGSCVENIVLSADVGPCGGFAGTETVRNAAGSIAVDPAFANLAAGDIDLALGSPCIGAGSDTAVETGEVDLFGRPRIHGARVGIGAAESGVPPFQTADTNRALEIAAGMAATASDVARQGANAPTTLADAAAIARRVAGLVSNP
jgi:hypothetical protein